MVSPVVLAFYTATATWLILKYRYLINTGKGTSGIDWRLVGELINAILVGIALTVAPYVDAIEGNAWCPEIYVPPLSTAALLLGVLAPLFDPELLHPGSSVLSSAITAAYLGLGDCWGLASMIVATALIICLIRSFVKQPQTEIDVYIETIKTRIKAFRH